jgi:hypothetical protein
MASESERHFDKAGREYMKVQHGTGIVIVEKDVGGTYLWWGGEDEDFIMGLSDEEASALAIAIGPKLDTSDQLSSSESGANE